MNERIKKILNVFERKTAAYFSRTETFSVKYELVLREVSMDEPQHSSASHRSLLLQRSFEAIEMSNPPPLLILFLSFWTWVRAEEDIAENSIDRYRGSRKVSVCGIDMCCVSDTSEYSLSLHDVRYTLRNDDQSQSQTQEDVQGGERI